MKELAQFRATSVDGISGDVSLLRKNLTVYWIENKFCHYDSLM